MLYTIIWWVFVVILGLLGAVVFIVIALNAIVFYYAIRIAFEVPPMTWLTLEELKKQGFPGPICRLIFSTMHERGALEVRPFDGLDESEQRWVTSSGFKSYTMEFYEFRISVRPRRRKKLPRFGVSKLWEGFGPQPTPVPA